MPEAGRPGTTEPSPSPSNGLIIGSWANKTSICSTASDCLACSAITSDAVACAWFQSKGLCLTVPPDITLPDWQKPSLQSMGPRTGDGQPQASRRALGGESLGAVFAFVLDLVRRQASVSIPAYGHRRSVMEPGAEGGGGGGGGGINMQPSDSNSTAYKGVNISDLYYRVAPGGLWRSCPDPIVFSKPDALLPLWICLLTAAVIVPFVVLLTQRHFGRKAKRKARAVAETAGGNDSPIELQETLPEYADAVKTDNLPYYWDSLNAPPTPGPGWLGFSLPWTRTRSMHTNTGPRGRTASILGSGSSRGGSRIGSQRNASVTGVAGQQQQQQRGSSFSASSSAAGSTKMASVPSLPSHSVRAGAAAAAAAVASSSTSAIPRSANVGNGDSSSAQAGSGTRAPAAGSRAGGPGDGTLTVTIPAQHRLLRQVSSSAPGGLSPAALEAAREELSTFTTQFEVLGDARSIPSELAAGAAYVDSPVPYAMPGDPNLTPHSAITSSDGGESTPRASTPARRLPVHLEQPELDADDEADDEDLEHAKRKKSSKITVVAMP